MEKLFYELKPFAFFYGSIYAIHNSHAYRNLVVPSALLLSLSAVLIVMMRAKYRAKKAIRRK